MAATLESSFERPRPHDSSAIRHFAETALDRFARYGLKPPQVWLRAGDELYDYEATVSLFKGQALLKLNSERLWFGIENLRTRAEADLALECGIAAVGCTELPSPPQLTFQLNLHAAFPSRSEADGYFSEWSKPEEGIVDGGCIAQIATPDLADPVRLLIERSVAYPNAAFLSIGARHVGVASPTSVRALVEAAAFALRKMRLDLALL